MKVDLGNHFCPNLSQKKFPLPLASLLVNFPFALTIALGINLILGRSGVTGEMVALESAMAPEAIFAQGVKAGEAGNYAEAVELFSVVLNLSPDSPETHYNRGLAWERLGNVDQAIADYGRSIALDRYYIPPYINRGNLYSQQQDHYGAIEDFTQAITYDPNRYKAYYNRANSYFQLGQYAQAIADYNRVLVLRPDYINAIYNRGLAHFQAGQLDNSRQDLLFSAQAYLNRGDRRSYLEALDQMSELGL
ncbi:tetratricopeptide repeat protein [Synechocystis sp. CACIAM 05]|uniref:tetratricopeptide repeat protein n=1 Tax=Synechocystis sp. CACIAM 05 TaxID=1933929 RepID=UPI00138E810C|nr:tetratricopeptide repeat protein [Synechocystis sp. CACIAM 05]QHV01442.1 hypothetical protein BWK47_15755 [Synechocystis sp. CACIAM 05]